MATPVKPRWYEAEFVWIEKISDRLKRFRIRIHDVERFDFEPGQFVTLELPIHERKPKRWRHYSIASPPDGNEIEIVVVRVEGGEGTRYLFEEVKEGTRVPLRGPLGKFTLPEKLDRDICFVCTGTGVAPFRSMLWHIYRKDIPHQNLYLVFGTRYMHEILYYEEFRKLEGMLAGFHYYVTLSRETSPEWKGFRGYVHQIYEELFRDRRPALFYLCGWKNMIDEARERLLAMGYSREDIRVEIYG